MVGVSDAAVWHDVECASYTADLGLWRELADAADGPLLDLGCGTGLKGTALLAARLQVTGVDISTRSVEVARRRVPKAEFIAGDMTDVEFPAASFDLVTAFYSVIHVPRLRQPPLFQKIARWLRPGGVLVATMGAGRGGEGYEDDFLGVRMYWSNWDAGRNLRMVRNAGLEVLLAERRVTIEEGRPVEFLWVTARATPARPAP